MKKILILLILSVLGLQQSFAQRDTEHWFAPYYEKMTGGYSYAFYLSTDSTVPFDVEVYSGNDLVATVNGVAKGAPQVWTLTAAEAAQYLVTRSETDAMTPKMKGLQLVGERPFLASLRVASSVHGETMTLKGRSAKGTEFRVAATPYTGNTNTMNATAGVLATEDNTTVTLSEYGTGIEFEGVNGTVSPSYTYNLNKGQSVVFSAKHNSIGKFIGAKIVSNKPVVVTNGNANGNFGNDTSSGSDLIMDQAVPIERLGSTFTIVRSLSPLVPDENMEGGMVIATENNTEVYINGLPTPVATLNAGQWYRIPSTSYVDQGNGHYNMYISTTKNVYLYQLVGMEDTYSGGYNYIPPLGCYLPRVIDEIGNINQMPGIINTQINLKLNIITQPGATVEVRSDGNIVNNVQGPFNVNGTTDWVTYVAPNITGNVTVKSTRAVTAGINGGYATAGYGGYFAGFSLSPTIELVSGECIPGIVIGVDPIYEAYQWFLDGVAVPGATSNTITPTQSGNYTLRVLLSGCDYAITDPYKVFPCTYEHAIDDVACGQKIIPVSFTNSSQPVDSNSISIVTQPQNGTLTINRFMNTVTYTPNPGYQGQDTFVYQFNSTVPEFGDKEIVSVKLNVINLVTNDGNLAGCPYNGTANYDLTAVTVTNHQNVTLKYYRTLADAQNEVNEITVPASFDSAAGDVFVRVITPEGCVKFAKITLTHNNQPNVRDASLRSCFIEGNPTAAVFDLTVADVGAGANFEKKYYASLADAEHDRNEIPNPATYTSPTTTVYVRVYNAAGCYSIAAINLTVIEPKYSAQLKDVVICLENRATLEAGPGFDGYLWSTGATTPSISDVPVGEYWVELLSNGCRTKQIVRVIKAPEAVITNVEISNTEATVTVTGGTPPYQYSLDGVVWQNSNVLTELKRGVNMIFVKDAFNCAPIMTGALVPNLINAITPNGDGVNDILDYSEISFHNTLQVVIYDRYGTKIWEGNQKNQYKWDGTLNGKKLPTDTYWYTLTWIEPTTQKTTIKYNGWIMVKNLE